MNEQTLSFMAIHLEVGSNNTSDTALKAFW